MLGDKNRDFAEKAANRPNDMSAMYLHIIYNMLSFTQPVEVHAPHNRVTCEIATLIDHIATTYPINISKSGILKLALSDHYMVCCIRKLNGPIRKNYKSTKIRNMKKFSEETLLLLNESQLWGSLVMQICLFNNVFSEMTENTHNFAKFVFQKNAVLG